MTHKEAKKIKESDYVLIHKEVSELERGPYGQIRSSSMRSPGKILRVVENQAADDSTYDSNEGRSQILCDDGFWYWVELIEKICTKEEYPELFL